MGQRASESITIDAPVDVVLEVISDLESYPQWADGVREVTVHERDDDGRPTRASFTVDARVMEVSYTLAYRYASDRVSWELVEGDQINQLDGAYDLDPAGERTGVTYALEVDVDLPLPGFLKKRAAKQILETGLSGLKERAESRA